MPRSTPDPDDLTTGFAVWAGTSFATPVIAGMLAATLANMESTEESRCARAAEVLAETNGQLKALGWLL